MSDPDDSLILLRLTEAVESIAKSSDATKLKQERDEFRNKLDSFSEAVIRFADRFENTLNADAQNAMERARAIRALHSDIYAIAARHSRPEIWEKTLAQ